MVNKRHYTQENTTIKLTLPAEIDTKFLKKREYPYLRNPSKLVSAYYSCKGTKFGFNVAIDAKHFHVQVLLVMHISLGI